MQTYYSQTVKSQRQNCESVKDEAICHREVHFNKIYNQSGKQENDRYKVPKEKTINQEVLCRANNTSRMKKFPDKKKLREFVIRLALQVLLKEQPTS